MALLVPLAANAYDACIDGIYYNIVKKAKQATVTYGDNQNGTYSGDVVIPETIEYEGVTCDVIAIGEYAFSYSKLTSVTIPSSVRSIGKYAFDNYDYYTMDGLYISDMAAWCEIEFFYSPLRNTNHFYLNGEEVIDLVVPDGVTKINPSAFCHAKMLKSAKLPESVMSIGAGAFQGCTELQSVNIPEGITTIEKEVFDGCGVSSITIPNSVTTIRFRAFSSCENLKSLTIGNGITTIESQAFLSLNNLEDVYISDLKSWIQIWKEPSDNFSFGMSVLDGPVYYQPLEYAKHLYLNGKEIKNLVIPEGVTSVPADAFLKFAGLTSVTIPDWVESFAFSGCANIKTITVGKGTDKIKVYGCESLSDLKIGSGTSINISKCNSLKKLATSDITEDLEVKECEKLETLVLGKSIRKCEIRGCKELTDVYCSVVPSFNSATFDNDCQIEYVTLHVPEIVLKDYTGTEPWNKFGTIVALKNGDPGYVDYSDVIQFADSNVRDLCLKNWDTNGDQLLTPKEAAAVTDLGTVFCDKTITSFEELKYFTGLTAIGDKAFYNCSKLSRITVPANVKTIGDFAFQNCSSLSDVALPDGVTSIGQYGFAGCSSFTALNIPIGVTRINSNTYADCEGIKEIIIPDHIVEIGNFAFARKHGGKITYEKVYIPNSINEIGEYIFDGADVQTVCVADIATWWNTPFVGKDFCSVNSFRLFVNDSEVIDLVIPSVITTIPNYKFYGCTSLKSLNFTGKVRFGAYAFQNCTGLTSVLIPIENGYDLGGGAFRSCSNLTDVYLPIEKPFGISTGTGAPFSGISNNATLHVPTGSVDAFIKQNYWTYWFANIVALQEGDPGYVKPDDGITLTAKSYTRQYGEANPTFEYTVTGGSITSGKPTISCSATATSPVGTYDIVISKGTVSNSGTVNLVKGTLTITKAPLTISAGNYNKVEGEDNPVFTPTFSGFKNNETKAVLTKQPTVTTTATKASKAGSYPVTVSGAEAQNYSISYQSGTLAVTASGTPVTNPEPYAVLSSDGKTVTFYYDAKKANRGDAVMINNSEEDSAYGAVNTAVIDASFANYYPTSTAYWFYNCTKLTNIVNLPNLRTDNVTNMKGMFYRCTSLTDLDVRSFKTHNVTNMRVMFDACGNLISLDLSGFETDKVTDMYGMFQGCNNLTSLDLSGFNTANLTDMAFMFNQCWNLTSLDLSGFNTNKVTSMRYMFEGCTKLNTIYVDGVNWSTANVSKSSIMFKNCPALVGGKGTVQNVDRIYAEYARVDGGDENPGLLTDVKAKTEKVTLTAKSYTREYGEANPMFEYTVSDGTITSGTPTITCSATATSPVGTYDIVISKGTVGNNGTVNLVKGTLTITKAPLTISAGNYNKVEGEDNPVFTPVFSGFKNNETKAVLTKQPTVTTTATKTSKAGSYPVSVSGAEAQNYSITYENGTLIVTEKEAPKVDVTLTAMSYTREYGEANPMFEYTVSDGTITSGTPTITCSATATSPVGTYDIVISKGTVGNNGTVNLVKGTLTITKTPLTIAAGNYMKEEGEDNPEFTPVFNGFKNGETKDVLTKQPTITTTATKASKAGNYPVTISGAEAQNYEITYEPGTLTVTEPIVDVTLTAKSYTREYGEDNPAFEYEVTEGTITSGTPEITCEATVSSPVGTYDIIISKGTVSNNGTVNLVKGTLTITKAPLTISVGDYTKEEGEDNPEFIPVFTGFKNNETEDVLTKQPIVTSTATKDSPAGVYEVTVSGAEAQNYSISYQSGTLTVTEKPVELEAIEGESTMNTDALGGRDLSDNVVGNIYYVIGENGYDSTDKSIVISQTTNMGQIADKEPGSKDVRDNFNGMILKVAKGKGLITVNVKTSGNAQLVVQVGNGTPMLASKTEKGDVVFGYDVEEDTYVYIYAIIGSSAAKGFGINATDTDSSVRIYSITVSPGATGIRSIEGRSATDDDTIYDLQGRRVKNTAKGVYIVGGRKYSVK